MGQRKMQDKQRRIYGARIRLGWFMEAERLGSVTEACTRLGVPKRTYYYWHKKWIQGNKRLSSLEDEPKTPKSHKKDPDEELVSLIVQLRLGLMYGEQKLSIIAFRDYGVKISKHGVHNILSRAGLLEKRKKKARRNFKLSNYHYKPGELMQMDVKHWGHTGYQYDIIDCCTRIKFKYIYEDYNVNTTVDFLRRAMRFYAPAFPIQAIQTDNGTEFTNNQFRGNNRVEPRMALPERYMIKHGIAVYHTPPSSPNVNGRIERPHGVDKWRYPKFMGKEYDLSKLRRFSEEDCLDYNTYRPHEMLHDMTPVEFLQSLEGYEHAAPDFRYIYHPKAASIQARV